MHPTSRVTAVIALASALLVGCEEKKPPAAPAARAEGQAAAPAAPGAGMDGTKSGPGHGGAVIALGEQPIGPFIAKATRDDGPIVAGKDAPVDVTITAAPASTVKVASARFWIGAQDAKGSVKARAEVEDPRDPNRWHVHVEIPNPLPESSKLWVEIEDEKGGRSVAGFDLKR